MIADKMAKNVFYEEEDLEYDNDTDSECEFENESYINTLSNEELDYLIENNPRKYIENKLYSSRSPIPMNLPASFKSMLKMTSLKSNIFLKPEKAQEKIVKKRSTITWGNNTLNKSIKDNSINERDFPSLSKEIKILPKEDESWVEVGKKKKRKNDSNKICDCDNEDCEYSHESPIIKKCLFDSRCNFTSRDKFGTYKNINKNKVCSYLHSQESMENYNLRLAKKAVVPSVEIKSEVRNNAFEILKDKEKIKNSLKFTKMCSSVLNNTECIHKGECRFAHNLKELNIRDCLFIDNCKFVKKIDSTEFENLNNEKICDCRHENESIENYYKRINTKSNLKKIYVKAPKIYKDLIKNMGVKNNINIVLQVY